MVRVLPNLMLPSRPQGIALYNILYAVKNTLDQFEIYSFELSLLILSSFQFVMKCPVDFLLTG